jgi:hypothetical protein
VRALRRREHVLAAGIALVAAVAAGAQDRPQATEAEIKAAFLFNFAKFVEWPAGAFRDDRDEFRVGVLGRDPFGKALDDAFRDKQAGGRAVRLLRCESLKEAAACHVLFLAGGENDRLKEVLEAAKGRAVLLVGERPGFATEGGAFNFFIESNRVRFEINPDAAERAGLKVSSKLLKLARVVRDP